jgi:predicted DNA-binding protein with PD1-like motif
MMRGHELHLGRAYGLVLDHGEDFFASLTRFCADNNIRQGYIPMFIAGFSEVEIVGTCQKLDDPQAPVWTSVHLANVEVLGGGTLAHDPADQQLQPHIHVTVGLKAHSATGHTSHLKSATVQFLTEMLIIEVTHPQMQRRRHPALYDVPLLQFAHDGPRGG